MTRSGNHSLAIQIDPKIISGLLSAFHRVSGVSFQIKSTDFVTSLPMCVRRIVYEILKFPT